MNLPKTLLTIAVLLIVLVIATDLSNRTDAQSSAEAYPFQVEHSEFYPEILGHIASKTENPTEDAVVCPTGRLWCDFNYDSILRQYKQKLNYITYFINHIKSSPKTGIFAHNKFLQDINISVSYYAGVSDASTGTNLSSGDTVPVGTELQFSVKPFESEDIEWFATGSFFDSPYGHWIDGAVMPDSRCMPGDRSVHAGWGKYVSYTPLSINPPEYSILHSGTANLACDSGGWNCTVESPGTISSTIVIDETYGHYYLDWSAVVFYFPHYCFRNLHPLVINDTGESRVVLDESADTFTHIVPEQNINILLNTQVDGDLPAPDISGPNKGLIDKVYTFTISGEHPELLPIRFGIDWINSIFTTVNKYTDYTENGSQEVGKSYSTTGNKKIHAISQDENNLNSPSSPVHNIDIGPWPEADLDADRTLIEEGESVSLTWSSEHAESCDGINFNTNGNTDGSVSVSPSSSTEYGVECVSSYDATEKATSYVTITVGEAESPIACGDIPLPEANPANPAEGQVDLLVNQSVIWSIPGGLPEGAVGTPEWIGDSPLGGKSGVSIGNIKYTTIGTKTGGYSVQDELGGVCEKTIEVEVKVDPGYKEI